MSMQLGINFGGSLEPVAAMGGMASGSDVGEGDPGHPPYTGAGHEPVGAFDFYWDEGDEVYRMRDPVVVTPDGGTVECESPEELEFGKKYYCVVGKKGAVREEGEEEYEARVVSEDEVGDIGENDYSSWWKVPLFKVPYRRFEENESDEEAGRQYHVGAIVVGGDSEEDVDHDTNYYADDKSIVNAPVNKGGSDSSGMAPTESNIFSLKGFGVFTKVDASRYGSFVASSELELSDDGMEGMSVLVRTGDVNRDDANELAYVKLKLPSNLKSPPTPFQYVEEPDEEQQGATIKSIVNCTFYFDGELKTLPDFSNVPLTGTVYLTCAKAAPESGSSSEPQWQFAVATSPAQAETDDKVINIKLYDFEGGKMTMDYRTTFLTLCSNENEMIEPDDVSTEFVPEAAPGATPTGDEGKLQIKGFKNCDPESSSTLGANLSDTGSASSSGHVLVRTASGTLEFKPIGNVTFPTPPTPPTVHDGTLTIKQGSTTLSTFTANQASNVEVDVKGKTLTFAGAPTSAAGADTQNQTYDGTAEETIHLDGLLTKGTSQSIGNGCWKTFLFENGKLPRLRFDPGTGALDAVSIAMWDNKHFDMWVGDSTDDVSHNFLALRPVSSGYELLLGTNAANQQRLRIVPTLDPSQGQVTDVGRMQIATLGWVEDFYLRLISATAAVTALAYGQQPTVTAELVASVQGGKKKDKIKFTFGIPAGAPGASSTVPGPQGVGIGSVVYKSTSGKTKTYSVMSDETPARELGTISVTDGTDGAASTVPGPQGVGIGSVVYKSTSGKTKTYSVKSNENPARELGTFTVTDGTDGAASTVPGPQGVGVSSASADSPTQSSGYTVTPVTLTLTNGNTTSFNVSAKNGTNATLPGFDFVANIRYYSQKIQVLYGHCINGAISYDQSWTDIATAIAHSSTVVS